MEIIANDGPDLDDCRALNPSPTSSIRPACSNNRRQSSHSSASKPARARFLRNLAILLLASFAFLAASFVLPAQAYIVPTSPGQPATAAVSHDDRFIASAHLDRASVARPSDADAVLSFIPGASTSPTAEWIKLQIVSNHPDGIVSQAFLDELYERLTFERRSDAASQVVPEPLLQGGASKPPSSRRRFWKRATSSGSGETCGETKLSKGQKAAYGILIPILVVLSGLFAGLTLGYMSLDETQLQVLALQGTPKQKRYAEKIMPIRKDGHLLLTTLLIANMITNETLPIIADPLLGGGVQAVIVSIVLVVIFAELIPQSVCSRYGLAIGAKLAPLTRAVMLLLWPIAFPVSRVLHWTLGPHHGIVYRRSELKELVSMHAATAGRGDLNNDTVTIVGGALDLQEKVVKQAMTPIDQVFMISIDSKLGYETLQQIVSSGHSRIPVYQEIEIPLNRARGGSGTLTPSRGGGFFSALSRKASISQTKTSIDDQRTLEGSVSTEKEASAQDFAMPNAPAGDKANPATTMIKRKKIIGALLVKQCVLLDPEDETPVRDMVINALPTVPADEPLLNLLNVFQEGRSHLAIVSSRTRRSSPGSFVDLGSQNDPRKTQNLARSGTAARIETLGNIDEEKQLDDSAIKKSSFWSRHLRRHHRHQNKSASLDLPPEALRDDVDASAVATEMAQRDVPIGIITLEDVLEELIGEEILDEYDSEVEQNFAQISPPASPGHKDMVNKQTEAPSDAEEMQLPGAMLKLPTSPKIPLPRFKLGRSVTQKDVAVGATPGDETVALPATPVTEPRAVLPATQEADASEPSQFPFDAVERGAGSRPSSRPGSRPVSPGPAAVLGSSSDAQLVAPRANKPVVIRHQAPDGTIATAIVGEGLLRGRTNTLASERTASGEVSRSTTPSGTRVSRFKSTPLPGTPAAGVASRSKTPGKPDVGSSLAEEVGSAAAPVASPEELDTDPAKKQLGGDSDETDTL
ncbi:hypothetical protein L1887_53377 [Cichorium endivia]|nr:hypothetical protein L1887_53377 [Cichorium endivia]